MMTEFPETRSTLLADVRSPENRQAWEEFVLIYRPVIYRMARRRGMQDADAQDLAQSVLVRVAGSIQRYEKDQQGTRFRHWIRRVATNTILSALTRAPKDQAAGGSEANHAINKLPADEASVQEELTLQCMREQYLRAAVIVKTDVSQETWRAFELSVIEGKACEEVAEVMGKSIGTVYASRSRVARRLRDQIRQTQEEQDQ